MEKEGNQSFHYFLVLGFIKIVIKRLMDDLKCGSMDTVEKLWDRVFGKANMVVNLPEQTQVQGIIPNTPISREAYIVIRDTLMK